MAALPGEEMKPVRVGLIGCGKVGSLHAAVLRSMPEAVFSGVYDALPDRSAKFAATYGAPPFSDLGAMLREVEAVVIGTPHPLHAEPAIRAAEAGAHVLVEKPMAATLADCDVMLAAARTAGVRLGVISQRRFYEPVLRMRAAIDAGKIGTPVLGVFQMHSWREPSYYLSDPWRGKWDSEGGGVLVNQSPHHLDILLWFMGPAIEVSGHWANLNHPTVEVEDTAVATVRFSNGGLGSILASLSQKPGLHSKIHIHGSNGASIGVETDRGPTFIAGVSSIVEPPLNDIWTIPGEESSLSTFQEEDRRRFASLDATMHYHALQFRDFFRSIRENRPPAVTGEDGRAVVELFSAIYRAGREGRAIPLPQSP
jgi:UDP-N-acetyl-2-amino-2-deoxyglucuronate dehydrogenase